MTIGDLVRHPEWQARTSGAIDYTGDVRLDNMLVGKILRSPHAHARILDIDTTGADGIDGVAAVLTPNDLPDRNYLDYGQRDRPALARGVVRHFGQEIALVAAETAAQADRAINAIHVRYRVLRPVTDAIAALQHSAPSVHPERGHANVATSLIRRFAIPMRANDTPCTAPKPNTITAFRRTRAWNHSRCWRPGMLKTRS